MYRCWDCDEMRDGQEFYANGYKKGYEDAKKEDEFVDQFSWLFDKIKRGEKVSPMYAVAVYNILQIMEAENNDRPV